MILRRRRLLLLLQLLQLQHIHIHTCTNHIRSSGHMSEITKWLSHVHAIYISPEVERSAKVWLRLSSRSGWRTRCRHWVAEYLKFPFWFRNPEQLSSKSKSKSECNSWGLAWLALGYYSYVLLFFFHLNFNWIEWIASLPCRAQTILLRWELHSKAWRSHQTKWWKLSAKQNGSPEKETEKLKRREPWALVWQYLSFWLWLWLWFDFVTVCH